MTGLELFKAPGTTAGEIADIVSNPCPPIVPETCDHISCRDCWLAWLKTGEAAAPPMSDCVIPKKEEAPGNQVPPEWEQRWVTTFGVDIEGKRPNSGHQVGHRRCHPVICLRQRRPQDMRTGSKSVIPEARRMSRSVTMCREGCCNGGSGYYQER